MQVQKVFEEIKTENVTIAIIVYAELKGEGLERILEIAMLGKGLDKI